MWGYSTGLRDALATVAWSTVFTSPVIEIRDGVRPSSPDDAVTGSLLCTVTLPTSSYFSAANGVLSGAGTWSGTVSASGTPTWFRMKNSADTGGSSTTNRRLDGDVGNNGELRLPPTLTALDVLTLSGFTIDQLRMQMTMAGFAGVINFGSATLAAAATVVADGTKTP